MRFDCCLQALHFFFIFGYVAPGSAVGRFVDFRHRLAFGVGLLGIYQRFFLGLQLIQQYLSALVVPFALGCLVYARKIGGRRRPGAFGRVPEAVGASLVEMGGSRLSRTPPLIGTFE